MRCGWGASAARGSWTLTSEPGTQHTTLWLVVTTHAVRRALRVTGMDQALVVYPALEPALAV